MAANQMTLFKRETTQQNKMGEVTTVKDHLQNEISKIPLSEGVFYFYSLHDHSYGAGLLIFNLVSSKKDSDTPYFIKDSQYGYSYMSTDVVLDSTKEVKIRLVNGDSVPPPNDMRYLHHKQKTVLICIDLKKDQVESGEVMRTISKFQTYCLEGTPIILVGTNSGRPETSQSLEYPAKSTYTPLIVSSSPIVTDPIKEKKKALRTAATKRFIPLENIFFIPEESGNYQPLLRRMGEITTRSVLRAEINVPEKKQEIERTDSPECRIS